MRCITHAVNPMMTPSRRAVARLRCRPISAQYGDGGEDNAPVTRRSSCARRNALKRQDLKSRGPACRARHDVTDGMLHERVGRDDEIARRADPKNTIRPVAKCVPGKALRQTEEAEKCRLCEQTFLHRERDPDPHPE
jgi:hypothetical protein